MTISHIILKIDALKNNITGGENYGIKKRIDGNEYKFVRSGLFGTGTYVKIYLKGRLIDEMEFEDMNGGAADASLLTESGYFESMCDIWASNDNFIRRP